MKWFENDDAAHDGFRLGEMTKLLRLFVTVTAGTMMFMTVLGMAGVLQRQIPEKRMPSMQGMAAVMSSRMFMDILAMEVPHLGQAPEASVFSFRNTAHFLLQLSTGMRPGDPKSWLAGEMTGLRSDSSVLLYPGKGTVMGEDPADYTPPSQVLQPEGLPPTATAEINGRATAVDAAGAQAGEATSKPGAAEAGKGPAIFIYHSHNRESFLPELKDQGITSPDLAFDPKINVTQVGKRLSDKLNELGIGTLHSDADYPTLEKGFNYAKSYAYSYKTVKEAFAQHPDLQMVFDLHRDSLGRKQTTVHIDGKDYAQVYFVVGKRNPNWEKNSEFASQLHKRLEETHPGISKGIYGKASNGNAEYNQSMSPNSILIEVGGPYSTMEEMNRTADVLAEVIAELYRNARKVSAPGDGAAKR
ncbi:stage II sporulation protein P [Paenibacillus sp. y28]|uniref:stage II sporulation protein P n=1 Tax=Paenibacillus sp. y28 TaxID=3129110 RepID=UPI003017A7E0